MHTLAEVEKTLTDKANDALAGAQDLVADAANPPSEMAERVELFAKLELVKRDLEAALAAVKEAAGSLQEPLLEDFVLHGVDRIASHGLTIFPKTNRYVSKKGGVPTEQICEVLSRIGWGQLVTEGYNANSLKSRVTQTIEAGEEVHPDLEQLLNIGETQVLASQVSSRRG